MSRRTTIILIVAGVVTGLVLIGLMSAVFLVQSGTDTGSFSGWSNGLGYVEITGTIIESDETVRQLKALESNPRVKGLLIRVNSPGGVVTPSHEIYSEIRRIRDDGTTVIVTMGSLAASGGYYVSAPADLIVASPQTLTGSIGVIMEFPVVKGVMDKLGVNVEVVKSAEHKDIGSPFRAMNEGDRELLQSVVSDAYEQFVGIVSEERELSEDSVRAFADGRILTGRQALALGLVDTLGTFEDAKRIAAEMCGLKDEPRLIRAPRKIGFRLVDMLFGSAEELFGRFRFPRLSYMYY